MEIINIIFGIFSRFLAIIGITSGFLFFVCAFTQTQANIYVLYFVLFLSIFETIREEYYEYVEKEGFYNGF